MIMSEFQKFEDVIEKLKQYLILNFEIVKLQAIEQASVIGASLMSSLIVATSAFLFVFTLSIGLGFYISSLLGDMYSGFLIIAGFYLLLSLILFIGRKKMLEKPLRDKVIQTLLNPNKQNDE
jgi:hypothetical protein